MRTRRGRVGPRMVSFSRARRRAPPQNARSLGLQPPAPRPGSSPARRPASRSFGPALGLPTSPRAREGRGGPRGAKGLKGALKALQAGIEPPPHPQAVSRALASSLALRGAVLVQNLRGMFLRHQKRSLTTAHVAPLFQTHVHDISKSPSGLSAFEREEL